MKNKISRRDWWKILWLLHVCLADYKQTQRNFTLRDSGDFCLFLIKKKKRWKGAIKISYIIFQYVQNKSCSVNHLNIKLFIIVQLSQSSLQNRQLGKNREGELWGFEEWNRLICKLCFFQLAWRITKNTITCSWDNTGFNIHVLIRTALILARTVDGTKQTATDSSDCVCRH